MTCDQETLAAVSDNFSITYYNYAKKRVQESPLSFDLNKFFPEHMSGTLILEPIIYGNNKRWEFVINKCL